jgi:uncharacterized membrane protein YeaQ/YmgE (transglycosylase-associated protein family)
LTAWRAESVVGTAIAKYHFWAAAPRGRLRPLTLVPILESRLMPAITAGSALMWAAIGLAVGLYARLFISGRASLREWLGTLVVAVLGSSAGGLIAHVVRLGGELATASAWALSLIGAVIALLLYNRMGAESGLDKPFAS